MSQESPDPRSSGPAPAGDAPPYREFVEGTDDLVMQLDPAGVVLFVNGSSRRILGLSPEECRGESFFSFLHPDDRPSAELRFRDWIRSGTASVAVENRLLNRATEAVFHLSWMITLRSDDAGRVTAVNGIGRDITERKALEAQLFHSQKMESIGRLAGGIAHDLNNVFSSILGYCELALLKTGPEDPVRSDLKQIAEAGKKAASLTDRLLVFSRKREARLRVIDLNETIRGLLKMLERMIGDDIRLVFEAKTAVAPVRADLSLLEQALLNLAVNARDAMRRGGCLSIRTDLVDAAAGGLETLESGRAVRLRVSDTGVGMTPEVMDRMYEPFFTTKAEGQGSGLGLSTVYGIVRQHGGRILANSAPGAGTTFTILLPMSPDEPESSGLPVEPRLHPGAATVLVVDDEPDILQLARDTLIPAGYRVLTANSGDEAIDICEGESGEIDVLLTDVIMPDMGGRELAEIFRAHRPATRIVFMSGYLGHDPGGLDLPEFSSGFLQKPLTPSLLTAALSRLFPKDPEA